MPRTDAGHQDDDVDLPGDEQVREVDGVGIDVETDFAERRGDVRDTAEPLDQPRHLFGPATLERRYMEALEVCVGGSHGKSRDDVGETSMLTRADCGKKRAADAVRL